MPSMSLGPSGPYLQLLPLSTQSHVFYFHRVVDLNEFLQVHHTANQINFLYQNPHLLSPHPLSHLGGLGNFWLFFIWSTNFLFIL